MQYPKMIGHIQYKRITTKQVITQGILRSSPRSHKRMHDLLEVNPMQRKERKQAKDAAAWLEDVIYILCLRLAIYGIYHSLTIEDWDN